MSPKVKAAFLDRDGVLNEERNYVYRIDDFFILPKVVEGLSILHNTGYLIVIVTNQSGIARGYYTINQMEDLHDWLISYLQTFSIPIHGIYYCPHHPDGIIPQYSITCDCRKPLPGMLHKAAIDLGIDLPSSVMIGDKISDVRAGRAAGLSRSLIVNSGHFISDDVRAEAGLVFEDLYSAALSLVVD